METEQTFWQQMLSILIPFALTALTIVTTWALAELRKWLKSKSDSEQLDSSLDVLDEVVAAVVTQINETVKQANADGVITREEAIRLKRDALAAIDDQLPKATRKVLEIWIDKLDDFIGGKIEVAVLETKKLKMDAGLMEPRVQPPAP